MRPDWPNGALCRDVTLYKNASEHGLLTLLRMNFEETDRTTTDECKRSNTFCELFAVDMTADGLPLQGAVSKDVDD